MRDESRTDGQGNTKADGYNEKRKRITEKLTPSEVLAQLAEEAAELAQAALKLRRVICPDNPTPIKLTEAVEALNEEIADVYLCVEVLASAGWGVDALTIAKTMDLKLNRWAERLEGANAWGEGDTE